MKHLADYIMEFQGWPDWDEADEIHSPKQAADMIKADKEFQKYHTWSNFYWSNDNQNLIDYLNDEDLELDDKEYICAELGLTGMLNKEAAYFEFVEPIKGKLSMYDDDFGSDDTSVTFCYDPWKYPKEFEGIGRIDNKTHYFYVSSTDCEQGMFDKRSHGKIPHIGLMWVMSTNSGVFPGYWCRDDEAKKDMMKYCGFEEFKKGNLINK